MIERESSDLEYKEIISNSFLKTVSAFANYSGGKIIFGINDNGETVGLAGDLIQHCLSIENMINDNLRPVPRTQRRRRFCQTVHGKKQSISKSRQLNR